VGFKEVISQYRDFGKTQEIMFYFLSSLTAFLNQFRNRLKNIIMTVNGKSLSFSF